MDQMIEQLQASLEGTYTLSEEEQQQLASYIIGQTPLETVVAFLPKSQNKHYYYSGYYRHSREIGEACQVHKALLPRLGRYLVLLCHTNRELYTRMLQSLIGMLTPKEVFLDSGFGVRPLLHWLFEGGDHLRGDAPGLLEYVYKHNRGDLEEYLRDPSIKDLLRPLSWYCARQKIDILADVKAPGLLERLLGKKTGDFADQFTGEILFAFMTVVKDWGDGPANRFADKLREHLPEAADILEDKEVYKAYANLTNDYRKSIRTRLFQALELMQYALPKVNRLARTLCEAHYSPFMDRLSEARRLSLPGNDVNLINGYFYGVTNEEVNASVLKQLKNIERALTAMELDPVYLCAWAMPYLLYNPYIWAASFNELFEGKKDVLAHACTLAERLAKVALLCKATPEGDAPQEAADAFRATLLYHASHGDDMPSREDVKRVADWVWDATDETDPALLPDLSGFLDHANGYYYYRRSAPKYDPDFAAWILARRAPQPDRYLRFILTKPRPHHAEPCADFLHSYRGWDIAQIAAWMVEAAGAENVILSLSLAASVQQEGDAGSYSTAKQVFGEAVKANPAAAAWAMKQKAADAAARLVLIDTLYTQCPDYDPDFLIGCLGDASKKVREYAVSFLLPKKELIDKIRPLQEAKKKTMREAADQIVAAFESESIDGESGDIVSLCTRLAPKSGMSGIRWAIPGDLPKIRWKDSGTAAEDIVVQCYLCMLLAVKDIEIPPAAVKIRDMLNQDDLRLLARDIYATWIADGARPKNKGALLMFGMHADSGDVLTLQKQIEDWGKNSRGAIAAQAVRAMAMGGSDLALMTVDNMARKFKNKQVRNAATTAMDAAAGALGITPEQLGDRIIPTLGFDERGEKVIDYGTRRFTAILSPELTVELQDATGKKLRSLPKPGAKDDEAMATRAKSEFAALKKSLKTVVSTQTQRLEQALATGRRWDTEAWQKLFVQNPIMHTFATGLVWGVYKDKALTASFRYMEDGSFTTADEDDFDFDAVGEGRIGLVHPLDLDGDTLAAWKQQVEDYDVVQPVLQLERPVFHIADDEKEELAVRRFGGKKMLGIGLNTRLLKYGWYKGSVQDGGWFGTYYREIDGIGMQLYFSGMYVAPDPTEVIVIGEAAFYRGTIERGSYVYDDIKKETVLPLREVPERLFSELCLDLTNATASATEEDPAWRKDPNLLLLGGKKA